MGRVYNTIDTMIAIICMPFYLVATPLVILLEWITEKRPVRLGLERTHWPAMDLREDYLVVDVSRLEEGLVGVRRRRWGVLGRRGQPPPPYSEQVEFISIARFWVPEPIWRRSARPPANPPPPTIPS